MKMKIKVSIRIFSETLTVEEMSGRLGITCSRSYKLGDPISTRSPHSIKHKDNIWILDSQISAEEEVEEHIRFLATTLFGHTDRFYELSKICTIECSCVIECSQEPPLNFPPDVLLFLSKIGASLDIDQYIEFPPEGDED